MELTLQQELGEDREQEKGDIRQDSISPEAFVNTITNARIGGFGEDKIVFDH